MTPATKYCTNCNQDKPHGEFGPSRKKNGENRLHSWCRLCRTAASREYQRQNRQKVTNYQRWQHIKILYGLSREQYESMFEEQGGRCAICNRPGKAVSSRSRSRETLCVDEDHEEGRIRALLCHSCNVLLGFAEKRGDGIDVLIAAIHYLEQHKQLRQPRLF